MVMPTPIPQPTAIFCKQNDKVYSNQAAGEWQHKNFFWTYEMINYLTIPRNLLWLWPKGAHFNFCLCFCRTRGGSIVVLCVFFYGISMILRYFWETLTDRSPIHWVSVKSWSFYEDTRWWPPRVGLFVFMFFVVIFPILPLFGEPWQIGVLFTG